MTLIRTIFAVCILASGAAFAEDAHHPDEAKAAPAAPPAKPVAPAMGGMHAMQEHMKLMRAQMEAIRSAHDPKERARLVDEHMKTMHEAMPMMGGEGMPMMGGGMKPRKN